jgi:hypothetical protein
MVRLLSERFPLSRPKHLLRRATKLAGLAARHITEGTSYRRAGSSSASAKIVTFNIVVSSYLA